MRKRRKASLTVPELTEAYYVKRGGLPTKFKEKGQHIATTFQEIVKLPEGNMREMYLTLVANDVKNLLLLYSENEDDSNNFPISTAMFIASQMYKLVETLGDEGLKTDLKGIMFGNLAQTDRVKQALETMPHRVCQ